MGGPHRDPCRTDMKQNRERDMERKGQVLMKSQRKKGTKEQIQLRCCKDTMMELFHRTDKRKDNCFP
jgi:hypothetical protein